ncbi:hypothetical protein [uncultured Anaerococcus sp.]|uniref:hypothetical protein n=1 Tax=uncultured Anaerococcus sp. TaxID=293428 RepID=UPI00262C5E68|nr:hypothetical protein [uncultured Anaerococcus sp.]
MSRFLDGSSPICDRGRIERIIKIQRFLKEKGKIKEAEELRKDINRHIEKYKEVYKEYF